MKLLGSVVIIIAVAAFLAGVSVKNSLISPFKLATESGSISKNASESAEISTEKKTDANVSTKAEPAEQNNVEEANPGYNSKTEGNNIVISGKFKIPDFYKLNYTFIFPKDGGDISGSVSGVCTGSIIGKSEVPDSDGEARIEGQYLGDCQPIPGLGFKTKASGTFEGEIEHKEGKIHLIYDNKEPFSNRGSFDLFFTR